MKKISILDSTIRSTNNTHRVVMIYSDFTVDGKKVKEAVGNCFVEKNNISVPKTIMEEHIPTYEDSITEICYYD